MCNISSRFKISLFTNGKYILTNSDKFLRFKEMEYLIHHVKVEICPALSKFPILFSAVKCKLRCRFSQFIYIFKIGTFDSWTQNPGHNILELYNVLVQIRVATSKAQLDIQYTKWIFELPLELRPQEIRKYWKNLKLGWPSLPSRN